MSDLISRQEAIDAVNNHYEDEYFNFFTALEILEQLPSAQPERKRGKWIHDGLDFPHGVDWVHCSVCGRKGLNVPADLTSFCPNCGADMRGED